MKKLKALFIFLIGIILALLLYSKVMNHLRYPDKGDLLSQETRTMVDVRYACDCPSWVLKNDYETEPHHNLLNLATYLEPANDDLQLPVEAYDFNRKIRFIGNFYEGSGYPKNYSLEQTPPIGKVFRYTDFEILDE